jgi:hypothetical protein
MSWCSVTFVTQTFLSLWYACSLVPWMIRNGVHPTSALRGPNRGAHVLLVHVVWEPMY